VLTPTNIAVNWIFSHFGFMDKLNRMGNQWMIPAMMANTAPMDRT